MYLQDSYINLFTDFGYNRLFGKAAQKDLLISFLNTLLPEKHQIQKLYHSKIKQHYQFIYQLHCTNKKKEIFIIELQIA